MKQNVYVAVDTVSGRAYRVIFADNDGTLCRDNVEHDIRSEKNPIGLPFKDLQYVQIAEYETQERKFINVEPRTIDILKSYDFKVEKTLEHKENLNESNITDFKDSEK